MFFSKRAFTVVSNSSRCACDSCFLLLMVLLILVILADAGAQTGTQTHPYLRKLQKNLRLPLERLGYSSATDDFASEYSNSGLKAMKTLCGALVLMLCVASAVSAQTQA